MHPILARRNRLLLYLAAWVPVAALLSGLLVYSGRLAWAAAFAFALPMSAIYAFLCLSAWYMCRTFPVGRIGLPGLLSILLLAALLSSSLWLLLGQAWVLALGSSAGFGDIRGAFGQQVPLLLVSGALLYFLAIAAHYLLGTFESAREAEKQALELQILAREAQLKALKAQIDPHFLFNSLNSISALTAIDPAASRGMCQMLADFLRKSLDQGPKESIPLEEELELVSSYLAIEKMRFGARLTMQLEISDEARQCLVPPLLLQPLVENAVRHGIAARVEGGEIRLIAERQNARLEIQVGNPVDPDQPSGRKNGIGIANVRGRLRTLYGNEASLDLTRDEHRFLAILRLPATEKAGAGESTSTSYR